MNITQFFEETLGAKLKNSRWSWGAIDSGGRVFLRVWKDQIRIVDSDEQVQVGRRNARLEKQIGRGWDERLSQLGAIRAGAEGFGVVCTAVDPTTTGPRRIKVFDERSLLRLEEIIKVDDLFFARVAARVPVSEILRTRSADNPLAKDLITILHMPNVESTVVDALVSARIGQGVFRASVLNLWGSPLCCIRLINARCNYRISHQTLEAFN